MFTGDGTNAPARIQSVVEHEPATIRRSTPFADM